MSILREMVKKREIEVFVDTAASIQLHIVNTKNIITLKENFVTLFLRILYQHIGSFKNDRISHPPPLPLQYHGIKEQIQ